MMTPRLFGATIVVASAALAAACAPAIRSERDEDIPVPIGRVLVERVRAGS